MCLWPSCVHIDVKLIGDDRRGSRNDAHVISLSLCAHAHVISLSLCAHAPKNSSSCLVLSDRQACRQYSSHHSGGRGCVWCMLAPFPILRYLTKYASMAYYYERNGCDYCLSFSLDGIIALKRQQSCLRVILLFIVMQRLRGKLRGARHYAGPRHADTAIMGLPHRPTDQHGLPCPIGCPLGLGPLS